MSMSGKRRNPIYSLKRIIANPVSSLPINEVTTLNNKNMEDANVNLFLEKEESKSFLLKWNAFNKEAEPITIIPSAIANLLVNNPAIVI